jgi:phospholipid/cholesterol/gamma-HCH transport system permease protein
LADRAAALVRGAPLSRSTTPIMVNTGAAEIHTARLPALSRFLRASGEIAELSFAAARHGIRSRRDVALVIEQLDQVGVRSLSIVNLTAVFMGMVLALQMGNFLAKFGAQIFVSRIVGVSLLRELAPVLTALMVGGRVGAGITAEIGSMAVSEQIDAIRSLGADPVRKLVVPRVAALLVMLPLLTVIADAVGIAGGCLISVTELGLTTEFYTRTLLQALAFSDFFSGLAKAVFFAYFIGIIACRNGLEARGGADGVGRATTATVVAASVAVLISDFFLSKLFLAL